MNNGDWKWSSATEIASDHALWLSSDPMERRTGSPAELLPEGSNLYGYAGNNPISQIDPDGEYVVLVLVVGVVVGAIAIYGIIKGGIGATKAYNNMQEDFDALEESILNCDIEGAQAAQSQAWNEAVNFTGNVASAVPNTIITGAVVSPGGGSTAPRVTVARPKPFKPPSRPGYNRVPGRESSDGSNYGAPYYRRPRGNPNNTPYPNNYQYPRGK